MCTSPKPAEPTSNGLKPNSAKHSTGHPNAVLTMSYCYLPVMSRFGKDLNQSGDGLPPRRGSAVSNVILFDAS